MNFFNDSRKLDEIFRNAKAPEISEFNGEYAVAILTGLPSLKKIAHRKKFYAQGERVLGCNVVFKNLKWGRFFLEEGTCEDMGSLKAIKINYNSNENSFLTNRIRDFVRCVEENKLYLGRLYFKIGKKLLFLGYFSLKK